MVFVVVFFLGGRSKAQIWRGAAASGLPWLYVPALRHENFFVTGRAVMVYGIFAGRGNTGIATILWGRGQLLTLLCIS